MPFNRMLKKLRLDKHLTQDQLAEKLKLSKSTISMYENGNRMPGFETLELFADFFNVDMNTLLDRKPQSWSIESSDSPVEIKDYNAFAQAMQQLTGKKTKIIPILGVVAAGIPMYAAENIIDEEEISNELANDGNEYFGLVIKGASMEPKLYDGDIIIVRKQDYIENGETGVIIINGDEATCKQVKEVPGGIMLIGHNTAVYQPTFYSQEDIARLPIRICGKVIEMRRKF